MLDIVIHPRHLTGQLPVIIPQFEHLHVCKLDQIDDIGRALRAAQQGRVPRK